MNKAIWSLDGFIGEWCLILNQVDLLADPVPMDTPYQIFVAAFAEAAFVEEAHGPVAVTKGIDVQPLRRMVANTHWLAVSAYLGQVKITSIFSYI